jgi:UDP-glucose 4-epimerase
MNCGYGHGASVLEVVNVVKQVSGVDFEVRLSPRRPGDPAQLVAKVDRIRSLGWSPQHDNLDEIVDQALRWERDLAGRKAA